MASLEQRIIGELECHVISTDTPPNLTAILCHGYGASGDDLVPVGAQLIQLFPDLLDQVRLIFPAGPLSLDDVGLPGGRAWWHLDMNRLLQAAQERDINELRKSEPEQMAAAREKLQQLIQQLADEDGLTPSQLVLGGFSQGAMLATDVALRMPEPVAGLVIWSGTLLNEEEWRSRSSILKNVPVVQSHGREDNVLPYEGARWLRELLENAGARLNFIGFRGPHTIPRNAVDAVGEMLQRLTGLVD